MPFRFGEITVYLQLHVVENALYEVLLGRPFDVLMKSHVQSFEDEDQVITVTCPNTGIKCSILTHARGEGFKIKKKKLLEMRCASAKQAKLE